MNGKLYAVGGIPAQFTCSYLANNEAYDPTTNTWSILAAMPTARESLAVGVINNILYAVGGGTGCGVFSAALEAYDPATNTWTSKKPMPTVRRLHAAGVANGILYVVGGYDGNFTATVLAYDPVSDTWTYKAPMSSPRDTLGVGVVNGRLYAVGGNDGTENLKTVEAYDPTTDTWTNKAPMPTLRTNFSVGVANGLLYVVGGQDANGLLASVDVYDPASDTWSTVSPMPTARFGTAADSINGTLFAIGGATNSGTIFTTNEAFSSTSPFAQFSAELEVQDDPLGFELDAAFTLAAGSSGINPLSQAVTLQVGSYSTTIPAGSFTQGKQGTFKFEGTLNGVALEVKIEPLGNNAFKLKAEAQGVDLTGASNPVIIGLMIGNNNGTTPATVEF